MQTTRDILKGLREAGFSQDEIARRTQISQPTLSRWETKGAAKGADAVLRLAALLNTVAGDRPVAGGQANA